MSRRKRLILLIAVLAVVGGGYAGHQWYLTTPIYALKQVTQSLQTHDWDLFTTFVDVDSVARGVSQDTADIARKALEERSFSELITKGLSTLLALKVRTSLREELHAWVSGTTPPQKGFLQAFLPKTGGGGKLQLRDISWKNDQGSAKIGSGTPQETPLELELTLTAGTWRITRIMNIPELYRKAHQAKNP